MASAFLSSGAINFRNAAAATRSLSTYSAERGAQMAHKLGETSDRRSPFGAKLEWVNRKAGSV